MRFIPTPLAGAGIIEPQVFGDDRGFFFESFNAKKFEQLLAQEGLLESTPQSDRPFEFVQDNHSRSGRNVLRGLHYQIQQTQAKLVRCVVGEVFDVIVDLRRQSPTFGQSFSLILSEQNKRQLWVPKGFAHGFLVLSDYADFLYKTTDYWAPEHERCLLWNDPALNINWPLHPDYNHGEAILSAKDKLGTPFNQCEVFE